MSKEFRLYYYWTGLFCESEFELGITVMTSGIKSILDEDNSYITEIDACFNRYIHKDLGLLGEEDENDDYIYEVLDGEEVLGLYPTSKGDIFICTSHDRAGTIIFLPEER